MGCWGANLVTRDRGDVDGFEEQTPTFVAGVRDGSLLQLHGPAHGRRRAGLSIDHVRWFHRYAARLTEHHLKEGLSASGATEEEAVRFAPALIDRIRQLAV